MKVLFAYLLATAAAVAQTSTGPVPVITPVGTHFEASATITLGAPIISFAPLPPRAPYTLPPGTQITLKIDAPQLKNPTVTWFKDGKPYFVGGPALQIANATPADTGVYYAQASNEGSTTVVFSSDAARLLINGGGQRLLNLSTRAQLGAAQPAFLSGFVIEPGPAQTMVLVRAVGPTLARFGTTDALAQPQLRLLNAKGQELNAISADPIEGLSIYPSPATAAAQVGAFPLPAGSNDIARVYLLSAGAYSAEVSSADRSAGTVLLEVYEVPLGRTP